MQIIWDMPKMKWNFPHFVPKSWAEVSRCMPPTYSPASGPQKLRLPQFARLIPHPSIFLRLLWVNSKIFGLEQNFFGCRQISKIQLWKVIIEKKKLSVSLSQRLNKTLFFLQANYFQKILSFSNKLKENQLKIECFGYQKPGKRGKRIGWKRTRSGKKIVWKNHLWCFIRPYKISAYKSKKSFLKFLVPIFDTLG